MTNEEIFDYFRLSGMTAEGACAVMGNYMAESSMIPNIAQRGMTKLTDAQYTAAADNGLLDFSRDQVGFGYAQWTYHTRKAKLLSAAKAVGVSVGDPQLQLDFTIRELKEDFRTIWSDLCSSHDLFQLTQLVCNQYENPAVKNVGTRYQFAKEFYDQFTSAKPNAPVSTPITQTFPRDPTILAFQLWMCYNGYTVECNGHKSKKFFDKLDEFVEDMKNC